VGERKGDKGGRGGATGREAGAIDAEEGGGGGGGEVEAAEEGV
jgi:hypothetical protein